MGTEKAGSWSEQEHAAEKKEVLGKVEHKLEGKNLAKELPDLISGIAKFRYPQDKEASVRESKKNAFRSALTDVASICHADPELGKYDIKKEDILEWCKIPILEQGDPPQVWENMSKAGTYALQYVRPEETSKRAETVMAFRTAFSEIGLSDELMPFCSMQVSRRDPDSAMDALYSLPKPVPGQKTYITFLDFHIGGSAIKIFFDSSNPQKLMMRGIVAAPNVRPHEVNALMTLGADKNIIEYEGKGTALLGRGGSLDTFLNVIRLAQQQKPAQS
jgi:hypothetical protein